MKRRVELSVGRLIWLCAISAVIGMNLTVLIHQIDQGKFTLTPVIGISALVVALAADIARRKPASS